MKLNLSKQTIDTLKKVYEVNQGIKFVEGDKTLKVKSTDNTLLMHAPIDEEFPRDFYVYNLREFLSVLSIIEDPTLDFSNDQFMTVTSKDGKQKLRYLESDPQFVTSYTDKEPRVPSTEFIADVTADQFASVMKAAQTMRLEFVGFVCDGSTITLTAFNRNNGDQAITNNFAIEMGDHDTPFEMFYKLDSQNIGVLLGEGDLSFEVSEKKISKVSTDSGKTFWIAMNANSKYGE
jgi:hypothetical protein